MKNIPLHKLWLAVLCSSISCCLLHADVIYSNDWQKIEPSVTPSSDVVSITIGNELILIPVDLGSGRPYMTGNTVYRYILNQGNFTQSQIVRSGGLPSGGEEILGWGSNISSSYVVTAQSNALFLEKWSVAGNGNVEVSAASATGNRPTYSTLSSCISTQTGDVICFYNPTANIAYQLNLKTRHWTSKAVSGPSPENLPGITSFGWTDATGDNCVGYIGGVNPDGSASNQGFYLNLSEGTAEGMNTDPPGSMQTHKLDGNGNPIKGILNFYSAYAAAVVLNNCPFSFGEEAVRNVVALTGIGNDDGLIWGSGNRYPMTLQPSSKLMYGDVSLAFSDTDWWGNSSRTNLPAPRFEGIMEKVSVNGRATLLYYGGKDGAGNPSKVLYRLDTEAPYDAPGTVPSFGIGQPAFVPYTRTALHYFSRNDNPSHLFTAVESEVQSVNTNLSQYFSYEGISHWVVSNYTLNSVPVYRMYNTLSGAHFYTANQNEVLSVMETLPFFSLEGVAFFVFLSPEPGTLPVYRFWVPETASHYFTISEAEKNQLIASGQQVRIYEGIAWYAYPSEN